MFSTHQNYLVPRAQGKTVACMATSSSSLCGTVYDISFCDWNINCVLTANSWFSSLHTSFRRREFRGSCAIEQSQSLICNSSQTSITPWKILPVRHIILAERACFFMLELLIIVIEIGKILQSIFHHSSVAWPEILLSKYPTRLELIATLKLVFLMMIVVLENLYSAHPSSLNLRT